MYLPSNGKAAFYPMLRNSASGPEIGLPGRMSAAFNSAESQNRPSGRPSAAGELILRFFRAEAGQNLSWKPDCKPGSTIA